MSRISTVVVAYALFHASIAVGQVSVAPDRPWAANIIVPQVAAWPTSASGARLSRNGAVHITGVDVDVAIIEQAARTRMDVSLSNPSGSRQEAELLVPVPDGVVIRGLDFQGAGKEPSAQLLPKSEARRVYESLVSRVRDPAILEFSGCNLVRTSVFPVDANGTQKVRLVYEQLLIADGDRVDYVLPRSESLDYQVPWKIAVRIASKQPIATVYSSSHELHVIEKSPQLLRASITTAASTEPGPFRLSYLLQREGLTASLMAYPDPSVGGGYFLLLASLPKPAATQPQAQPMPREVTLVLDRSGSMGGNKIQQVQEAARQIVTGLREGESFNIIAYNDTVGSLASRPLTVNADNVRLATEFIRGLRAGGGTNLHAALVEALRPAPRAGSLPLVLFLTDGQPTVGDTRETAIRDVAIKANPHGRRVFTIGVGVDVNAPLLDKIANETRAVPTLILPDENVETKVAGVFKRMTGPVLTDPKLEAAMPDGRTIASEMLPARLPDLFEDDQLVVLGRYTDAKSITFKLSGLESGVMTKAASGSVSPVSSAVQAPALKTRSFNVTFSLENATTRNAFVPRLWASRRIAVLIDAIRQMGADSPAASVVSHRSSLLSSRINAVPSTPADPRQRELVDEIVKLSLQYGILTEYTAFLAREDTNLSDAANIVAQAGANLHNRAVQVRSGAGGANQSSNLAFQSNQVSMNIRNSYLDENLNRVSIANVQQVNNRALYNRQGRWIESTFASQPSAISPRRTIAFDSKEYFDVANQLIAEGRQGAFAVRGDVIVNVNSEPVLIQAPAN